MSETERRHFLIETRLLRSARAARPDLLRCFRHPFDIQFQARLHQLCPLEASRVSANRSPHSTAFAFFP